MDNQTDIKKSRQFEKKNLVLTIQVIISIIIMGKKVSKSFDLHIPGIDIIRY